jgi:hypothetical protein
MPCTFQSRGRNKETYMPIQPMVDKPRSKMIEISGVNAEEENFIMREQMLIEIFPHARQMKLI